MSSNPSSTALDFVQSLLVIDENERLSAQEALNHKFIQRVLNPGGEGGRSDKNGATNTSIKLTPLLQPLGQMNSYGALKKQSMMAIAFSMNQAQIDMLRDCFCEIDKDHNGTLDKVEFKEAFKKVMPLTVHKDEDFDAVFDSIDQDKNGEISYLEFLAAAMDKNHLSMKQLESAFKLMDVDGNGFLELEDFSQILGDSKINNAEVSEPRTKRAVGEASSNTIHS